MIIDDLLLRTSRTFALAIPLLPEPTRRSVSLSYLLFRIADTFEDAANWDRATRIAALAELARLLADPRPDRAAELSATWLAARPTEHEGYLELLGQVPFVLGELERLAPSVQAIVVGHTTRTVEGMMATLAGADEDGSFILREMDELRLYCYRVAGIVGELLTALFLHDSPRLVAVGGALMEHQAAFGEGLQLVNILKDERDDEKDGRRLLPASVERSEVLALARADLERAGLYVELLRTGGAPPGVVAFTSLPAALAWLALERIEKHGPGAKVAREEVLRLVVEHQAIARSSEATPAFHHSAIAHSGK
jgi:farnesyl-diphosphate farnesyltransferase